MTIPHQPWKDCTKVAAVVASNDGQHPDSPRPSLLVGGTGFWTPAHVVEWRFIEPRGDRCWHHRVRMVVREDRIEWAALTLPTG